ncbi:hypothetical protein HanRHA438_Chr04g0159661 [Helianthus annuus]|nr:hypothetical protein HanHA89_Chr04g0135621 [Helianthus annuus]KAJ0795217.1 hypothetical protein HanPI659440_Chr04g0147971 [Helianthus annuus]KAJ0925428.1 hypothetical protein HanRHA438_Chr04g0159661 [Helianthus annuus]
MGAAMALYSATCCAIGQFGNGNRYPINLSMAVALSGWLPCSRKLASEWKKFSLKEFGITTSMIAKSTRIVLNGLKRKGKLIQ